MARQRGLRRAATAAAEGPIIPPGAPSHIVEEVFVVYEDGRLMAHCARDECTTADGELLSGPGRGATSNAPYRSSCAGQTAQVAASTSSGGSYCYSGAIPAA